MQAALAVAELDDMTEDADHDMAVLLVLIDLVGDHAHQPLLVGVEPERVFDAALDDVRVERTADVVGNAETVAALNGLAVVGGGDHDDRNLVDPAELVHVLEHGEAVHLRHIDVEQHQIDVHILLEHPERLRAVHCLCVFVSLAQDGLEHFSVHLRVVNDQDFLSVHSRSTAAGSRSLPLSDLVGFSLFYYTTKAMQNKEKLPASAANIIVQPGEKVPIDGVVVEGHSSLNTSALTGESVPREVAVGEEIISGCINMTGLLKIRTTKEFGESTVSKILELVENSSSRKSRSENFITRFAKYYTPAVCYSALALAVLPTVINLIMGNSAEFGKWIERALTFLVISCPCALVISIPLSFFGGIGGASARGILVKGSSYLELLSQSKYIVFDKTGTLTEGVFKVTDIRPQNMEERELLYYAAYAESYSTHPISKSLKEAYAEKIDNTRVTDVEEISGHGVSAMVDGHQVYAGNGKLMKRIEIQADMPEKAGTVIHVAVDGRYAGYILISDVIKKNSKAAIQGLKEAGVKKTVMLTGDAKKVADSVAAELGVDEVHSELLPADKVEKIEELIAMKGAKEKLAFVGDGINDAPVLSRADIGIAMGAMGSDAAIEAADIVLMDDDPAKIALAMKISRKTLRIVYENIVFALAVKFVCLVLGALGIANMWIAIFADVGVMVIAVLNATRALRTGNL